jgi:hypothetical protein
LDQHTEKTSSIKAFLDLKLTVYKTSAYSPIENPKKAPACLPSGGCKYREQG